MSDAQENTTPNSDALIKRSQNSNNQAACEAVMLLTQVLNQKFKLCPSTAGLLAQGEDGQFRRATGDALSGDKPVYLAFYLPPVSQAVGEALPKVKEFHANSVHSGLEKTLKRMTTLQNLAAKTLSFGDKGGGERAQNMLSVDRYDDRFYVNIQAMLENPIAARTNMEAAFSVESKRMFISTIKAVVGGGMVLDGWRRAKNGNKVTGLAEGAAGAVVGSGGALHIASQGLEEFSKMRNPTIDPAMGSNEIQNFAIALKEQLPYVHTAEISK